MQSLLRVVFFSFISLSVWICASSNLYAQQKSQKIDSLRKLLPYQNQFEKANTYRILATYSYGHDSLLLSYKYASLGIRDAKESNNSSALGSLFNITGYIYTTWGNYLKAIEYFTKGVNVSIATKDTLNQVAGFHGMGRVYTELRDFLQAERAFNQAMKLVNDKNNDPKLRAILNDLGVLRQYEKKYDESIKCLERSMEISLRIFDTASYLYAMVNIGELYRNSGNFDKAEFYYNKALQENEYIQNVQVQAAAIGNLAHVFAKKKEYQKAIELYNESIEISKKGGLSSFQVESYKSLSDLYLEIGDYKNSVTNLVAYNTLKDSLTNQSNLTEVKNLQIQFEIDRKDVEIKLLQQKYRNRNIILFATVVLIVFFILILILLYSRYKLNQKLHRIETKQLSLTIDEKNRELVSLLLNSSRKENLFEDLSKTIDGLNKNPEPENVQHVLSDIRSRLKSDIIEENNWESIKLHFEQVHPDFFSKLKKLHPNLTQSELKMCAYIKINMSTKDIAGLINIGIRGVQTSRYRLKKKLNLEDSEDLILYLQNL